MSRIIRSELVRLKRRSFVLGWIGLTAVMALITNLFVFQSASEGTRGGGPGADFPTLAQLVQPGGLVAPIAAAVSLLGVISLVFWALATTGDFTSGVVRLTAQAEPRRWRLVVGKAIALLMWTVLAATVAMVVTLLVAWPMAGAFDVSTAAWSTDLVGNVASTWLNLFLALAAWGMLGLVVGMLTRSSGAAIGIGVGYALLFEPLLGSFASGVADKLPANVLSAVASGGNANLAYGAALALGAGYAALGLGAATATFARRDISD
jgi:ABC-type transport system involved in multi-copper enzyme maturation permease subunit